MTLVARMKSAVDRRMGFLRVPMHDLELFILSDGYFDIGPPQPILAPDVNADMVRNELHRLGLPENLYEAPIITLLIKKEQQTILIDTGEGYHGSRNAGWLTNSLAAVGVRPEDVTDILITHAHRDHIGGILTREGDMVYRNARYYISRPELDFWTSNRPDFSASLLPVDKHPDGRLQKEVLQAIAERLQVFQPGDMLFSCIRTGAAPGHTPGHIVCSIFSGSTTILHLVDVVHSPLLIARPEWGTQWDVDFAQGVTTRQRLLETCYHHRIPVTAAHLPWPGIGYISKADGKWCWLPMACSHPFEVVVE